MERLVDRGQIEAQIELWQGVQSFFERVADRPWVALVELLLIGSVVYIILRFFQGTRGARLVRAVLTILAVSFALVWLIAEKLESERIKVLYPYFILGVFLVSLVAFQTELRRFLLRLGEGGWLQRWMRSSQQAIDPIVSAVERLSKKKIGALIAVARSPETEPMTETGVRLDAVASTELLETIFWPGTPLHDLGIVIHQGRVLAAGCQFPLTESGDVDRSLGSRHRAAIGMSQEVDAIVIVVSEETGTISVANRGRLRRAFTPEALRGELLKELSVEQTKRQQTAKGAA
ncbi:MAG: diadenylate cyclase CdaA [Phycisphaerales bacterium]|nr:MAG: diadenylate cyclase CdaA [Phycisphaerales bacterium]